MWGAPTSQHLPEEQKLVIPTTQLRHLSAIAYKPRAHPHLILEAFYIGADLLQEQLQLYQLRLCVG